jgi:hypothetical protein
VVISRNSSSSVAQHTQHTTEQKQQRSPVVEQRPKAHHHQNHPHHRFSALVTASANTFYRTSLISRHKYDFKKRFSHQFDERESTRTTSSTTEVAAATATTTATTSSSRTPSINEQRIPRRNDNTTINIDLSENNNVNNLENDEKLKAKRSNNYSIVSSSVGESHQRATASSYSDFSSPSLIYWQKMKDKSQSVLYI